MVEMLKHRRKAEIIEYIKNSKVCSIDELKDTYNISISTLHRDLNELLQEGKINKSYGKVAVKVDQDFFNARKNVNVDLKKSIAKKALEYVKDNDCLFLDNSTTVYYFAELLVRSLKKQILVVSNSAFLSDLFLNTKNISYVSTGGMLNTDLNCYVGKHALEVINDFNADRLFMSCSGLSVANGISDIYIPDEQVIKSKMREKSKETFLLVDSSKVGNDSVAKWFNLTDVNHIVTDDKVNQGVAADLASMNCDVIVARV
jgi:DeoR family myo-inositol catabolism operon transcriptional repressor